MIKQALDVQKYFILFLAFPKPAPHLWDMKHRKNKTKINHGLQRTGDIVAIAKAINVQDNYVTYPARLYRDGLLMDVYELLHLAATDRVAFEIKLNSYKK